MPVPPTIETPRLILRPITLDDADDIFAYAQDDEVTRYVTWPPHRSIEDSRRYIRSVIDAYPTPRGWYSLGIVWRESGRVIGMCGPHDVHEVHRMADYGWVIGRTYWGRGIMPEAAGASFDWLFRNTDVNRIEASAVAENRGSWRVMEKLGMTYEGTLRECRVIKGQTISLRYYSLLRSEWKNAR